MFHPRTSYRTNAKEIPDIEKNTDSGKWENDHYIEWIEDMSYEIVQQKRMTNYIYDDEREYE